MTHAANRLYLAWQDPQSRSWHPVGILWRDQKDDMFRFTYTKAASDLGVVFGRMDDHSSTYVSSKLFPLFQNRLLDTSRPEYDDVLRWLGQEQGHAQPDPLSILGLTNGRRATDNLQLFPEPRQTRPGEYEIRFFVHGIRHLADSTSDLIEGLQAPQVLYLMRDVQNPYDDLALGLRSDRPTAFVGYCPRFLSADLAQILDKDPTAVDVEVDRVNENAPPQMRLLCRLVARPAHDFRFFSRPEFQPLGPLVF